MISKIVGCIVIGLLTVGAAIVQGSYLNRWGTPPDMRRAIESLDRLPKRIGDFEYESEGAPLDESTYRFLKLSGHLNRTYVDHSTGDRVMLLLLVGEPGPLVRHPPTICYSSIGMQQIGDVRSVDGYGSSGSSQFKVVEYRQPNVAGNRFILAFSHAFDEQWSAPEYPRLHFGGLPYLYKVQVLVPNDGATDHGEVVLNAFLNPFVREFARGVTFDD